VRALHFKEAAHLSIYSNNSGTDYNILPETVININHTFTASAIDVIEADQPTIDKNVKLRVFSFLYRYI
jgi:hypothetical protein